MAVELIEIKEESLKRSGIPFKPSTLYVWHHKGIHTDIFVKIGSRLFVNKAKWQELVEKNIGK